ncbi:hypothetical protein N3K66_006279 [Trichothecium roseum]|uniref:Uncharacterized protein n=1 Tax=Trichothecium roseum TaxID=47278 RepID=A0ACC0V090_9HYPO|nr:hypothetical protein N3K66_006279 [Trichothecium roseum]
MITCLSLNANPKALVVNMKSNLAADLVTLSYAKLLQQDTAEANRLLSATQQDGIFYLSFDASQQLSELHNNVNTLFDLGAQTMENERYRKPGMQMVDDKGHRDRTEFINVRENDLFLSDARLDLPHSVNGRRETLTSFAALCFGVSSTLLRNFELALGMPPDMLTNMHSTTRANSNRIAVTRSVTNSDEVEVDVPARSAHTAMPAASPSSSTASAGSR